VLMRQLLRGVDRRCALASVQRLPLSGAAPSHGDPRFRPEPLRAAARPPANIRRRVHCCGLLGGFARAVRNPAAFQIALTEASTDTVCSYARACGRRRQNRGDAKSRRRAASSFRVTRNELGAASQPSADAAA